MAINKKLIHFNKKATFDSELSAGNILDTSIVFIKDANLIWTHGNFYGLSEYTSVPTLDSAPTEDTLTYTDTSGEHSFVIGGLARVSEDNDYVFYRLYDITSSNKAVWKSLSNLDSKFTDTVLLLSTIKEETTSDEISTIVGGVDGFKSIGNILISEIPVASFNGYNLAIDCSYNDGDSAITISMWYYMQNSCSLYFYKYDKTTSTFSYEYTELSTLEDAPKDGKKYIRSIGDWIETEVPTLSAIPSESTLSYNLDNKTIYFSIGDFARVLEVGEYVFYQLFDITSENKAVWKKAGSGGTVDFNETLQITLTSNQAQPDESLNGAVVHVKYGDEDIELTWEGEVLTTKIPMSTTYNIIYPAIEGYATPESVEYTAVVGNTRSVTATYNTTVLTLTLTSNQTSKSDLVGATLTLSGSISKTLTYSDSGTFEQKVPLGEKVTITPSSITGYKTPSAVTKTPTAATDSATFTYQTEVVTVTVKASDSSSCSGQIITVNGTTYTYSSPFSVKIPFGTSYSISANAKSMYSTPATLSFTANSTTRSVTMTYTYLPLGVYILDTDGNLTTAADWNTSYNSKAVGVAVMSSSCKFVIAPAESSSTLTWGGYGTTISDIVTTTSSATAKTDFAGESNTTKIIAQLGTGNAPAAEYCRNYTFKNGKKGYLWALGELNTAYSNKSAITTAMSKISGTAMTEDYYWSSTQYDSDSSWFLRGYNGNVGNGGRDDHHSVRAVCALTT